MRNFLRRTLWPTLALLVAMTILTGAVYPALVTAIAGVAFPREATGSMIVVNGAAVGSSLIGQCFDQPKYFWGRSSAAGATDVDPCGYDASGSGGTNLGPTSTKLIQTISERVDRMRAANGGGVVPVDLVTASASGLDPDISPAAAAYQVARVAAARGLAQDAVRALVAKHTEAPLLGFLGEPRVNVLLLNLDLDGIVR